MATNLGGVFQDMGVGARPLGMGGAFTAVADDANAAQENPAGMAFFDSSTHYATFSHSDLYSLGFLSRDFLAYAQGDEGYGAVGLSWNRLSANLDPGSWNEDAIAYSGAKQVLGFGPDAWAKLAVGWQLKYLRVSTDLGQASVGTGVDSGALGATTLGTSVAGGDAQGWGTGMGALLKLGPAFSTGLMVQDLYSTLAWGTGNVEQIPMTVRLGMAYRYDDQNLVSVEGREGQLSNGFFPYSYNAGAEHWFLDGHTLQWGVVRNIGFRAGYYDLLQNYDGGVMTFGATVKADMWAVDYTYEYGLSAGGLGDTQRLGLDLQF